MPKAIISFKGEYAFLSNFYPCRINLEEFWASSAEHAFQALKCIDEDECIEILEAPTPAIARRLGRKVKLENDWNQKRLRVMEYVLQAKFSIPELREKLLATGDAKLIESNTWGDKFWGCIWENDRLVGQNHLGQLLMQIRNKLCVRNNL